MIFLDKTDQFDNGQNSKSLSKKLAFIKFLEPVFDFLFELDGILCLLQVVNIMLRQKGSVAKGKKEFNSRVFLEPYKCHVSFWGRN